MMLAAVRTGCAILLAGGLGACASIKPPPPLPGTPARLPEIGESVLSVGLSADYAAMSAAANSVVPQTFFDFSGAQLGQNVTFRLTGARGDIEVSRIEGQVAFSVPVSVDGMVDSRCPVRNKCRGTLHVDGRVWGRVDPEVRPDWTVRLLPKADYLINEAEIGIPLFNGSVSFRRPLEQLLKRPFQDLVGQIDREVSSSTALRCAAAGAWTGLGKTIQVSAAPPVWLSINPTRILAEQPSAGADALGLRAALIARPELVVGDRPPDRDPGALPDLTVVHRTPDQFSIYLPVRLTYQDATDLARQMLAGREIDLGGGATVEFGEVSIFNNGDEVGVKLAFRARSGGWRPSGTLYLLGTPVYNLQDGYIAIENLHFDIRTRDAILKLAAFLTRQSLIEELQSRLHFDVRSQAAARRQELGIAISSAEIAPGVTMAGEVTSLAPSAVYLTRDFLQANVVALGTLRVRAEAAPGLGGGFAQACGGPPSVADQKFAK